MGLGYGLIFRRFFWKSTWLSTNFFYLDGSLGGQRIFPTYWNEGQSYLLRQTQDIFLLLGNVNLFSLISTYKNQITCSYLAYNEENITISFMYQSNIFAYITASIAYYI